MLIGSGICGFNFNCPSHPFFSCHLWGKICRKKLRESTLKIARQFCLFFSNPTRRTVSATGWASYKLQNHQVWLLESLFVQPPALILTSSIDPDLLFWAGFQNTFVHGASAPTTCIPPSTILHQFILPMRGKLDATTRLLMSMIFNLHYLWRVICI